MERIGLGRKVVIGNNEYLLQNRPYEWAEETYFEEIMGRNNCTNVTLRELGEEPIYSSLMLVFDNGKTLRRRDLLGAADEISAELIDAVTLAKYLHKKMKISDEELSSHPIIIIPQYYDKERDFARNEIMANGYFAGTTKTSYSILAVNLTPCTNQFLRPYFDNFKEGEEILIKAHMDSKKEGFKEIKGDPTMYATARYVAKQL